jgi:hypothetical protein
VKLDRKLAVLAFSPALLLLASGCGGINASRSISPASFFLPGLGRATPIQTPLKVVPYTNQEFVFIVAQAN